MCSKSVNKLSKPWSMVTRLTLWFTVAAIVIEALVGIYIYHSLQHTYQKSNRQFLLREMQVLNHALASSPGDLSHLKSEQMEGLDLPSGKYYSRILDSFGKLLSETPGMSSIMHTISLSAKEERIIHLAHERSYYILLQRQVYPLKTSIVMALDISNQAHHLKVYRSTLLVAFIFGALLSGMAAYWVSKKGLQPLSEMAQQVSRITVSDLKQPIEPGAHPQELITLVDSFNGMLIRLDQSFERLEQFSADLAHELRTPLNNLIGESEVQLGQVRTPLEYQQLIASNLDEYHRLSQIVESLLFLARAANTELSVKKSELDLATMVQGIFSYFEALAADKNISLTCQGQGMIQADAQLIRRVLTNLVHNSLKYTGQGGTVNVLIGKDSEGLTTVVVKDNGEGIEPQHLPRLFDRFYRVSASRTEPGTGLGLSIVKSIMQAHRGKVAIESQSGIGTTVTLLFI